MIKIMKIKPNLKSKKIVTTDPESVKKIKEVEYILGRKLNEEEILTFLTFGGIPISNTI